MNILIVDDDPDLTDSWVRALAQPGHAATVAETVPCAMYAAMTKTFDLVLCELFVGDVPTVPFCHYMAYAQPVAPVVMVTGSTLFTGGEAQRLAANIALILQKPVPTRDLVATAEYMAELLPGRQLGLSPFEPMPVTCPRLGL